MTDQRFTDHLGLAYWIADQHYLPGGDRDDVRQEAAIALWQAVCDYQPGHGTTFKTFANLVIYRRLAAAIKNANRGKHLVLTRSARVTTDADGQPVDLVELLPGRDMVDDIADRHELHRIRLAATRLTTRERQALGWILDGKNYRGRKDIDNAADRARRKLAA